LLTVGMLSNHFGSVLSALTAHYVLLALQAYRLNAVLAYWGDSCQVTYVYITVRPALWGALPKHAQPSSPSSWRSSAHTPDPQVPIQQRGCVKVPRSDGTGTVSHSSVPELVPQSPSSTPAGACFRMASATLFLSRVAKLSTSFPSLKNKKRGTLCTQANKTGHAAIFVGVCYACEAACLILFPLHKTSTTSGGPVCAHP
jgi:hypothetical protein